MIILRTEHRGINNHPLQVPLKQGPVLPKLKLPDTVKQAGLNEILGANKALTLTSRHVCLAWILDTHDITDIGFDAQQWIYDPSGSYGKTWVPDL